MTKIQEVKDQAMGSLAEAIEQEKKEQWRVEGRHMLFDAKRVRMLKKIHTFLYVKHDFFMPLPLGGGRIMF